MLLQVLRQVDAADGSPSFDLNKVASQNEAQVAAVLQTVSAHLNSLDRQFHAERVDTTVEEIFQVLLAHSTPVCFGAADSYASLPAPHPVTVEKDGMHAQVLQTGLAHHKQKSSRMVASALTECRRDDAQFLSGIKEACSSFRSEVSPLAALPQLHSSPFRHCCPGPVSQGFCDVLLESGLLVRTGLHATGRADGSDHAGA